MSALDPMSWFTPGDGAAFQYKAHSLQESEEMVTLTLGFRVTDDKIFASHMTDVLAATAGREEIGLVFRKEFAFVEDRLVFTWVAVAWAEDVGTLDEGCRPLKDLFRMVKKAPLPAPAGVMAPVSRATDSPLKQKRMRDGSTITRVQLPGRAGENRNAKPEKTTITLRAGDAYIRGTPPRAYADVASDSDEVPDVV
jgi:hypothetical protein